MTHRYRQRVAHDSLLRRLLLPLPLLGAACSHAQIVQPVILMVVAPVEDPFITKLRETYKKAKPYVMTFYSSSMDLFLSTFRYPLKELDENFSVSVLNKDSRWFVTYDFLGKQTETQDITDVVRGISSKIGEVKGFDFVLMGSSFDGSVYTVNVGLVPKTNPFSPLFEEDGTSNVESKVMLHVSGQVAVILVKPSKPTIKI